MTFRNPATIVVIMLLTACNQPAADGATTARRDDALRPAATVAAITADPRPDVGATPAGSDASATRKPRSMTQVVAQLRTDMAGTALLDGRPVSAVRETSTCVTTIVAGGRTAALDWSKAGNLSPYEDKGRQLLEIAGDGTTHVISTPLGDKSDAVTTETGLLALNCDGRPG